jgi:lysophospholipid acyltransferase (LPLAT)-like uncharacterized protein
MPQNPIKNFFKKHKSRINGFISWLIHLYLALVYKTTRLTYELPHGYTKQDFDGETRTIFVMWHNRLALAPYAFKAHKQIYVLASSHSDGKIIADILMKFGYHIIEGSSNRAPIAATRQIIRHLNNNKNIAITPDGPRGPMYKVNSNLVGIARIAGAKIIPISFIASNAFRIGSWDRLIMPLPLGSITARVGEPLEIHGNDALATQELEDKLNELSK